MRLLQFFNGKEIMNKTQSNPNFTKFTKQLLTSTIFHGFLMHNFPLIYKEKLWMMSRKIMRKNNLSKMSKFEEVMNFWNLTREVAKIGRIACERLLCNNADGRWDLRSKIGVQQLPLFKFLLSGDMKIKIFVSTRLKVLKYIIRNFCPKIPPLCLWYECSI